MPILTTEERIGTILDGKIRLDRVLGEGGMGVVFEGTHLRLDRRVAVKFLHPRASQSATSVERFLREARATSRLTHPNVIDVRDVDVDPNGSVYMVLELLEGESLRHHLDRKRTLDVDETLSILGPVMDALVAAHAQGIVHRDIKPENVFLSRTADGRTVPKVLDFGLARFIDVDAAASPTATGAVMGTPRYMSPEQASGNTRAIGEAADIWAVGVMAYECLCGALPFEVQDDAPATMVIVAVITGRIVPLTERRPDLAPIWDVLSRALERRPEARIRSMAELRTALAEAAIVPRQSPPPPSTRANTTERIDGFARTHASDEAKADVSSVATLAAPVTQKDESLAEREGTEPGVAANASLPQLPMARRGWLVAGAAAIVFAVVGIIVYAGNDRAPAPEVETNEVSQPPAESTPVAQPPEPAPQVPVTAPIEPVVAAPVREEVESERRIRPDHVVRREPEVSSAPTPVVAPAPPPRTEPARDHRAGEVSLDDF